MDCLEQRTDSPLRPGPVIGSPSRPDLPATIAIKHQIRMRMARYEVEKAKFDASTEVFRGKPSEACNDFDSLFVPVVARTAQCHSSDAGVAAISAGLLDVGLPRTAGVARSERRRPFTTRGWSGVSYFAQTSNGQRRKLR